MSLCVSAPAILLPFLAFWFCDAAALVPGCRTRVVVWGLVLALWFGERRADGMGAVCLGPVRPGARAGILSQVRALFFCGGGGEGEGDETSCCDYSRRCCMLGFALGVLSGESRAVNQIIAVKDHCKCSWPCLDHWMQAQATASTTALIDELSLQLCCSLECPSCSA
jgi:hypothetical protein